MSNQNIKDVYLTSVEQSEATLEQSHDSVIQIRDSKATRCLALITGGGNWKPWTLWPITHLAVAGIMLAILSLLQVLWIVNNARGGLAFTSYGSDFSLGINFLFFYFPTLVAVCISMLWGWIELDVKRLEPYFQMSKYGGESAENSILLSYPFDFLAFAPIKAIRRRHWAVAITGIITLLIFWVITPLQSTIFSDSSIIQTVPVKAYETASLTTLTANASNIGPEFIQKAWVHLWHNASLPPFATRNGTIIPFNIPVSEPHAMDGATVQVQGTFFSSTLDCDMAIRRSWSWERANGANCTADKPMISDDDYSFVYYSFADNAEIDYFLDITRCDPIRNKNVFFGAWANTVANTSTRGQDGAFFCEHRYWLQPTTATLHRGNLSVIRNDLYGVPRALSEVEFNATKYEAIISTGYGYDLDTGDAPAVSPLAEGSRLQLFNSKFEMALTNMAGMALAANGLNMSTVANTPGYLSAVKQANSLVFAYAASDIFSSSTQQHTNVPCQVTGTVRAVTMNGTQLAVFQSFLGLVAAMSVILAATGLTRPNKLVNDPDCLAAVARTVTKDVICWSTPAPTYSLGKSAIGAPVLFSNDVRAVAAATSAKKTTDGARRPQRPFYIARTVGVFFILILAAVLALLLVLQNRSFRENGLPPIQTSDIGRTVILNYLPIMFATLLEPFWVLLNRTLCVLQPFEDLRSLDARPRGSILARYTSLPPQLVFFRATLSRHFLLALVCITAFSCNILSVSMSALFDQQDNIYPQSVALPLSFAKTFSTNSSLYDIISQIQVNPVMPYEDHLYVADSYLASATSGANSPLAPAPWTFDDTFFVPVPYESVALTPNASEVTVATTGFTVGSECTALDATNSNITMNSTALSYSNTTTKDDTYELSIQIVTNVLSSRPDCATSSYKSASWNAFGVGYDVKETGQIGPRTVHVRPQVQGPAALEFVTLLSKLDNTSTCPDLVLGAWLRDAHFDPPATSEHNSSLLTRPFGARNYSSASFFVCHNSLSAATYSVKTDLSGNVLASPERTSAISADADLAADHFHANATSRALMVAALGQFSIGAGQPSTHNTTMSSQWFPYIMSRLPGARYIAEPAVRPAPSAARLAALAEKATALLGVTLLAINHDMLLDRINGTTATVTAVATSQSPATLPSTMTTASLGVRQTRIFLDPTMLYLSVALIAAHLLVAVVFYIQTPKKLLPELPVTIAAQMALFEGSSLLDSDLTSLDRDIRLGYGSFVGTDGVVRTGIERAERVTRV